MAAGTSLRLVSAYRKGGGQRVYLFWRERKEVLPELRWGLFRPTGLASAYYFRFGLWGRLGAFKNGLAALSEHRGELVRVSAGH